MVDFTRYQVPGVYVEDSTDPIVVGGGLPPSLVCIVGPARGFQNFTETVIIFSDEATVLSQRGIVTQDQVGPPAISAPRVTTLAGGLLAEGTDYVLDTTSDAGGSITTIERVEDSPSVGEGMGVIVEYSFVNNQYFAPRTFDDFSRATAVYGRPLVTEVPDSPSDSHVDSPLSLGIQKAFENGAAEVLAVACSPVDGDLRSQFLAAYEKIQADYRATIVVPVFPDEVTVGSGTVSGFAQQLAQDLRTHCVSATNQGYNRIGIFGLPRNYDETELPVGDLASSITSSRLVLVYPTDMQMFNPSIQQTTNVSGCYVAAAFSGRLVSLPTNEGMTKKILSGFRGIDSAKVQEMSRSAMNELSSSGVSVIEMDRRSRLMVRHGVTTDFSALNTREISLIRINDAVHQGMQIGVENANLIGAPIDAEMVVRVQGVLQGILEQMVIARTIVSWRGLNVTQQSTDPSVIEARFEYRPAIPLNYIVVSYSLDLSTGDLSEGIQA